MKRYLLALLVLIVLILGLTPYINKDSNKALDNGGPISATTIPVQEATFKYNGKNGVDALRLLKEKAEVEESQPGFIISINGRKADDKKKEFWSFYVNGEMAQVGAGDYVTKDTDLIEWKIENY